MGREIRIWGKPILGEKRFWILGQFNTQNACPFGHTSTSSISSRRESLGANLPSWFLSAVCSSFTILELPGTSLAFLELLCIPHPCFYSFLHFPHDWESKFANLSSWALGLTFLLLFPRMGIRFCNAQCIGEEATIYGCLWRLFFPTWSQWTFGEIDFGSWGCFTHLPFFILASKTFLSVPNTVIVVYWIHFWPR